MFRSFYLAVQSSVSYCAILHSIMPIIQDWVTFGISVFCFTFPSVWFVSSCESKLYYALVISCMALREQKLDDRAGEWVSFSCSHAAIFCHPLSKWRTMLIRRIDKKTSIDQVLKLLREAKEFLSGSLRDNIPLANSTSIHNPNRSERIASNLRALFSTYDDSPVSSRRPAPQSRNQIAGPPKTKGRHASVFFKPRETWTHEFLWLSYCRQEVVLLFNHVPSTDFEEKIEGL